MRKILYRAAVAALIAVMACFVAACGGGKEEQPVTPPSNKESITVSDSGFLTVDGVPTAVRIRGYEKSEQDKDKSAYEIFISYYPEYEDGSAAWEKQLREGTLFTEHSYEVIADGSLNGQILSGSAKQEGDAISCFALVAQLTKPAVLPFSQTSYFKISVDGILAKGNKGSGGGQLLTNSNELSAGRIYLGTNCDNNFLFLGVNIGGVYINYGFTVNRTVLSSNHSYELEYDDGNFYLSVDGGDRALPDKMNVNQSRMAEDMNAEKAADEIKDKIFAATGSKFFTFGFVGANSHKADFEIERLSIETSAIFGSENVVHPLAGKKIFFLGSSVTRGHGGNTDGVSFADDIAALTGANCVKEAVSGTTLIDNGAQSYISRFKNFDFSLQPCALVLQLSTNDFNMGYSNAQITQAVLKIVEMTKNADADCKLYVYTCPLKDNLSYYLRYAQAVEQLQGLKGEYGFEIIDLFNADFIDPDGAYLQSDGLHPTREGYASLFVPKTIAALMNGLE